MDMGDIGACRGEKWRTAPLRRHHPTFWSSARCYVIVGRIQRSLPARAEHALHDLLNGRTVRLTKLGVQQTMGCVSSIEPVRARTSRSPSLTPPS
jgi:hypothetical protein